MPLTREQQLDKIRQDWKPGARLGTWGPKDAAESINFLLKELDARQQNKVLALLLAIAFDGATPPNQAKAVKKVLAEMPREDVAKAAATPFKF